MCNGSDSFTGIVTRTAGSTAYAPKINTSWVLIIVLSSPPNSCLSPSWPFPAGHKAPRSLAGCSGRVCTPPYCGWDGFLEEVNLVCADMHYCVLFVLQVEGTEEDWFVYKLPRRLQPPQQPAGDQELAETVNVGRHNITKVWGRQNI